MRPLELFGYLLTPPTFLLNLMAWLTSVDVNQCLTMVISILVIIFWINKNRNLQLERKSKEIELKLKEMELDEKK